MSVNHLLMLALCIGIALQMLGAPVSFFHFDDPLDLVESSIQEGFSLASSLAVWDALGQCCLANVLTGRSYHFSTGSDVFHPPLALVR